jgi:ParB/RepB/Spo0J family partition protein
MDTHVSRISASESEMPSIRLLTLSSIEPSSTAVQQRRRARYNAQSLKELAENIKSVHVIEPIIVRPRAVSGAEESFELIAGERRWRASQQAGLELIPAIVRHLDDGQVLEIQLVENLHREDLHELEEAEGYETLMREHHYSVDELITKLGKSRAYVYTRLKLLALDKRSRDAFYAGKLTAATALLLARIPVIKLQQQALKAITQSWNGEPMPLRLAQRHILDHYMTHLKEAPFDIKAADLVPNAGPCGSCPKRTGNQPELFGDVKGADLCTDPECFAAKRSAWGVKVKAQAKAEGRTVLAGKEAKRIAPYGIHSSLQGGFVLLDSRCYEDAKRRSYRQLLGKDFRAKTLIEDTESGSMAELIKLSEHSEALKLVGVRAERTTTSNEGERARRLAIKTETLFRERLFSAIRAKTPAALSGADLRLVAKALWDMAGHDACLRLVGIWQWADKGKAQEAVYRCDAKIASLSEEQLRRFVIDCALVNEVRATSYDTRKPEKLLATAKRLRIDARSLRQALKSEPVAKSSKDGEIKQRRKG